MNSKKTPIKVGSLLILFLVFSITSICQSNCASDADVVKYKNKVLAGEDVQSCTLCSSLAIYLCRSGEITNAEAFDLNEKSINRLKRDIRELGGYCCPELLGRSSGNRPSESSNTNAQYDDSGIGGVEGMSQAASNHRKQMLANTALIKARDEKRGNQQNNNNFNSGASSYSNSSSNSQTNQNSGERKELWNSTAEEFAEQTRRDQIRRGQQQATQQEALNNLAGSVGDLIGGLQSSLEKKRERERQQAYQAQLREDAKKRQEEYERRERERIRREKQARSSFLATLKDGNMPVQVSASQTEVFCFFVNKESSNAVSFSMFNLYANNYNKLPYKVDIVKEYQKQTGKTNFYLYGPYNSLNEAKSKVRSIVQNANNNYIDVYKDVIFEMGQNVSRNNPAEQTPQFDAWGNKISPSSIPKSPVPQNNTPKYDAWGNPIKSKPKKTDNSFQPVHGKAGPKMVVVN